MSIKSDAFGRVELTGEDARKFKAQATYGRAKEQAKAAAAIGQDLARKLHKTGSVRLKLKASA